MASAFRMKAPLNSRRQFPADKFHVGQTTVVTFEVVERDRIAAVDLTGLAVKLRGKVDPYDDDYLFEIDGSLVKADYGLCKFTIPATAVPDPEEVWAELLLLDGTEVKGIVAFFLPFLHGASF